METTRLDRFKNGNYRPGTWLARITWLATSIVFFQTRIPWPSFWKRLLLKVFGARVGKGVIIKPRVTVKYPWKLTVGDHCWIGENVWIDNLGQVTLGNHCCLSQGALLLCGNHNYKKTTFDLMVGDITLEDGVWIGARASVGPGVTCGSHSVLAMGSVATQDLEAWTIHHGTPSKVKGTRQLESSLGT
jgi:putative colanic acid biosynthesis acetyltransferase WcaF